MELLGKLGIDWRLLIAQIINFLLLLVILYRLLYKPVIALLDQRSAKIEKSLQAAQQIEANLKQTESERAQKILAAKKEAAVIINQAKEAAAQQRQETIIKARAEVAQVVAASKQQLAQAKDKMVREAKAEVAEVVVLAAEKILAEKLDSKKDQEIINQVLSQVKAKD